MQIRRNLNRCHQNDKTVTEYVHELTELFNMIGDVSERDQVLKFWNGSRAVIQKGLWRDNLNPEVSSWSSVVAQAEIIEISENVADRRDRRIGSTSQPNNSYPSYGGGSNRAKNKNTDRSSRSVSFEHRSGTHSRAHRNQSSSHTDNRSVSSRGRGGAHTSRGRTGYRGSSRTSHNSGIDNRSTPRITDKEKADRLAAGQCFVCGGSDHFSRDCPTKKIVKSTGGKPPGTSSFNIEPSISENEDDATVEVLDSLPLGAISFEPDTIFSKITLREPSEEELEDIPSWPVSEWQDHYPYWKRPDILASRSMGYVYLMAANTVLTLEQPYPGDQLFMTSNLRPEHRFLVRERQFEYEIYDALVDTHVFLPKHLLKIPRFNLSRWYAMKRVRDLHLSKSRARSYYGLMGHTLCEVAQVHLTHGIHTYYPSLALDRNPSERFAVIPWPRCKNEFIVTDIDLMIYAELSREQLENTSFDIVGWYIDILKNRSLYPFSAKAEKDESCCRDSHVYVGCSHLEDDNLSHGSDNEHAEEDTYNELLEQQTVSDGGYEDYRTLEYFENLPHFHSLLHDEDSDDEEGITDYVSDDDCASDNSEEHVRIEDLPAEILAVRLAEVLTSCQPYPGDGPAIDATYIQEESRFIFARHHPGIIEIYDRVQGFETHISLDVL